MKIGLIDIDGKIPNLALMKISAYHKGKGDDVELTSPLFAHENDICYASKVFTYSHMPILPPKTTVGGTGTDDTQQLPPDMEYLMPDYSLYDCDYAIGYTTRGCNRSCPFCVVPKREGKFRVETKSIKDFWDGQDRIMLLDNAINTDEEHFITIADDLSFYGIKTDFSQGLDIRLFTRTQACYLSRVPLWKQIHFAWDNIHDEKAVMDGINILEEFGLKYRSMFYVLIGFNSTERADLHRVLSLEERGVDPFVMPYNKADPYQRNFARWANHKAIFKSVKWEDYKP